MNQPYNPNIYPLYQQDFYARMTETNNRRREEKKQIRRLGACTGGAVLTYLLIQYLLSMLIPLLGLTDLYLGNELFGKGVEILLVIFSILPAFMLFGRLMKTISGISQPISYARPKAGLTVLAFFSGLGLCMLGNFATSFVSIFMAFFGYGLSSPDIALPRSIPGIAATVIQIVFVAALVEEISLRGHVLGNLRKHGDSFAIFISSLVFALMHGNLVQTPFALVAGFGLAYFCIKLRSLWPSILIHAANNLLSVALSYIGEFYGDEMLTKIYLPVVFGLIVTGGICFAVFSFLTRKQTLDNGSYLLSAGEKLLAFISAPTVILAFIAMMIITAKYIVPIEM